jgi:membrane protein DedA with SNARE-associated domain
LLPATLAVVVVTVGVATRHTNSVSSTILIMVAASVSMQVGYFAGMLFRRGLSGAKRLSSFSHTTSARDPAR